MQLTVGQQQLQMTQLEGQVSDKECLHVTQPAC